ncbi:hypothetical protein Tcan_01166, partial [Toxocara canis]
KVKRLNEGAIPYWRQMTRNRLVQHHAFVPRSRFSFFNEPSRPIFMQYQHLTESIAKRHKRCLLEPKSSLREQTELEENEDAMAFTGCLAVEFKKKNGKE